MILLKINVDIFFLAVVGAGTYKLLKDLSSPDLPSSKGYEELKKVLLEHYSPKPVVIAERHKFWTANQGGDESVASFIARLKNLSTNCDFGDFLKEALRDRLVSGLHAKVSRTQMQLLSMANLSFEQARTKCLADEMAAVASREYRPSTSTDVVYENRDARSTNKDGRPANTQPGLPVRGRCKGCGGSHHRSDCRYKDVTCHKCRKKGHIQRVCRYGGENATSSGYYSRERGQSQSREQRADMKVVEERESREVSPTIYSVCDDSYQNFDFFLNNVGDCVKI